MGYQPPFTITPNILNLVSLISEKIGELSISTKQPFKLRKISRIKTLAGTLQIEGSTLSEEKITALLDGKRVLGTVREVAEAKGAIELYDKIEEFDYKSQNDLLKSHKILMHELLKDNGKYRQKNVVVGDENGVTHVAPPFDRVPDLMCDLFEWLGSVDIHPLISSSVFHYEFEFIHPFSDGNGRMGRFWQSLILYDYKDIFAYIPIESMVRQKQDEYYAALEDSSSVGESTPFIEYMLDVILETIKESEKENVPLNVPKNVPLNRLDDIIKIISENRDITSIQIAELLKVSDKTIKRDIAKLKEQGRLKRVGSLKSGYWEIIE